MNRRECNEAAAQALWLAVSEIVQSLINSGADEGCLRAATEHLDTSHKLLSAARELMPL